MTKTFVISLYGKNKKLSAKYYVGENNHGSDESQNKTLQTTNDISKAKSFDKFIDAKKIVKVLHQDYQFHQSEITTRLSKD